MPKKIVTTDNGRYMVLIDLPDYKELKPQAVCYVSTIQDGFWGREKLVNEKEYAVHFSPFKHSIVSIAKRSVMLHEEDLRGKKDHEAATETAVKVFRAWDGEMRVNEG